MASDLKVLVRLSRKLGDPDFRLAILAEGNTSMRVGPGEFAVKASGCNLASLSEEDITVCGSEEVLRLLQLKNPSDTQVDEALLAARVDRKAKKPSVESIFHAWLLTLDGVNFVGHTHPITVNQVLCSPRARDFAEHRVFPDEVVCCGPASVFVPYLDPGLPLARGIRDGVTTFMRKYGITPRVILLQNHGLITLGATPESVIVSTMMTDKAAAIFMGAAALGGPNFLTQPHVDRIAGRADEAHRQRQLKLS